MTQSSFTIIVELLRLYLYFGKQYFLIKSIFDEKYFAQNTFLLSFDLRKLETSGLWYFVTFLSIYLARKSPNSKSFRIQTDLKYSQQLSKYSKSSPSFHIRKGTRSSVKALKSSYIWGISTSSYLGCISIIFPNCLKKSICLKHQRFFK